MKPFGTLSAGSWTLPPRCGAIWSRQLQILPQKSGTGLLRPWAGGIRRWRAWWCRGSPRCNQGPMARPRDQPYDPGASAQAAIGSLKSDQTQARSVPGSLGSVERLPERSGVLSTAAGDNGRWNFDQPTTYCPWQTPTTCHTIGTQLRVHRGGEQPLPERHESPVLH